MVCGEDGEIWELVSGGEEEVDAALICKQVSSEKGNGTSCDANQSRPDNYLLCSCERRF